MGMWTGKTIEAAIREAKASGTDLWLTADGARGAGRLRLRAHPGGGASWYFRYSHEGQQRQIPLGVFDSNGEGGLSLKEARARADELSRLYQSGVHDLHDYIEHQLAEAEAARQAAQREREKAEREAVSGSLAALCAGYVTHLGRLGKSSARQAHTLFQKNVLPILGDKRAKDVTPRDVNGVLAKLIDAEHGRTAGKTRSYLHAAFAAALAAEFDPTVHPALHGFNLVANPVAAVPAKSLARYNVPGERTLSESELSYLLKALEQQHTLAADAILLGLYLGGQRPSQLLRVAPTDVSLENGTIVLFDPKGARQKARKHELPLNAPARDIVTRLLAVNGGKSYLFATRKVPLRVEKLSAVVTTISEAMEKAANAKGETVQPFHLRDVRRTVETMLAKMGISSDVCAQLLSHGLGGVQQRHYNRHSYMNEKKIALEAWAAKLEEIETGEARTNVLPLRASADLRT